MNLQLLNYEFTYRYLQTMGITLAGKLIVTSF